MTLYVHKNENGEFVGPSNLPKNFANVSNFFAADPETILEHDWFVYEDAVEPAHDPANENTVFELVLGVDNVVHKTWTVVEKTQPEKDEYAQYQIDMLTGAKAGAKIDIDSAAEYTRLKYITNGAGQAAVYIEKGEEAADYVAAGYPADLTSYPFIQAEVSATGLTAAEAADIILAQKAVWIAKGAQIEHQRILGKLNVTTATTVEEVETARLAAVAALGLL